MRTSNIGDKRAEEIMEFPSNNKPESVFIDLFFEPTEFSRTSSEKSSIFSQSIRMTIFPHEITESITETRSYHCHYGCHRKYPPLFRYKKSPHKNHNIHAWHYRADERKRFCHGDNKENDVVPISPRLNLNTHPINNYSYEIWTKKS